MKLATRSIAFLLSSFFLAQSSASAQTGPPKGTPKEPAKEVAITQAPQVMEADIPPSRFWARGEYLLWWTRGDRLPPLVTTSPTGTAEALAGVLGEPGTTILFGDSLVNNVARSGGRGTLGFWFNSDQSIGLDGNFFGLVEQTRRFSASSPGDPILARPFFQIDGNRQNALLIAFPGLVSGSIDISASSNFFGAELLFRSNLYRDSTRRLDILYGYRFLQLDESLQIRETEINLGDQTFPIGTRFDLTDSFNTRNQFHGAEIGLEGEVRRGPWSVTALAKIAFGWTQKQVEISGSSVATAPGEAPVSSTGALLALPSNIGRYRATDCGVVPEFGLRLNRQITDTIRVGVGYTLIYWNNVARPGEQIDLGINTTQPPLGAGLVGPARPAFGFRGSDFWAQGIDFALEFRY